MNQIDDTGNLILRIEPFSLQNAQENTPHIILRALLLLFLQRFIYNLRNGTKKQKNKNKFLSSIR